MVNVLSHARKPGLGSAPPNNHPKEYREHEHDQHPGHRPAGPLTEDIVMIDVTHLSRVGALTVALLVGAGIAASSAIGHAEPTGSSATSGTDSASTSADSSLKEASPSADAKAAAASVEPKTTLAEQELDKRVLDYVSAADPAIQSDSDALLKLRLDFANSQTGCFLDCPRSAGHEQDWNGTPLSPALDSTPARTPDIDAADIDAVDVVRAVDPCPRGVC